MSRSSYTASERRGVLAVAILSLLIVGGGICLSLCGRNHENLQEIPVVTELPEMIDSTSMKKEGEGKTVKKKTKRGSSKEKSKKSYRRRSPHDEPV